MGNLGSTYIFLGKYQRGIDFLQQYLAIAREMGDRQGETNSLNNLGVAYEDLREYQRAIDFYQQSLAIAREIVSTKGETISLSNLGSVLDALGKTDLGD